VRIIAGSKKGATIYAPKHADTRPTGDRVREAAFNLIGPVDEASVLDLYAGSGAMGLEALSRGASSAVFVESDREACRTIQRNLEKLRLDRTTIVCSDAVTALAQEASAGRRYDLVLVDPPYPVFSSVQPGLARYLPPLLEPGALVVVETAAAEEPELPLPKRTSRRYGAARLTVFGSDTQGQSLNRDSPCKGTVPA
jgi:16S rRNA (guanine966-N2)-methyltransferase